jgi:hypothetical protein
MTYPVLVEPVPGEGYAATVLGLPACRGHGATKEVAVEQARAVLSDRLQRGEVVFVQVEDALPSASSLEAGEAARLWTEMASLSAELQANLVRDGVTPEQLEADLQAARQEVCLARYGAEQMAAWEEEWQRAQA